MVVCSTTAMMAEGGMPSPSVQEQKNSIGPLLDTPLKTGDTWYLIDLSWLKQWKRYVGYDERDASLMGMAAAYPGPIDNSTLLKDDGSGELRPQMIDGVEYELVPEPAWTRLQQWYSLVPQQQPIARKVIESGVFMKVTKVEVYLLELKLSENSNLDHQVVRCFSKEDSIAQVEKVMRDVFGVAPSRPSRVWNRYTTNTYELLRDVEASVSSAGLYSGQILVLEVQSEDGTWPRGSGGGSGSLGAITNGAVDSKSSSSSMLTRYGPTKSYQPGLCGLSNLGNTCFMNSVIQCLSNTPPLSIYFNENRHLAELNTDNPMGMRGEIARAFGSLLQEMWSGRHQSTVPRTFKHQVSRFAPQFSGYQQHDSQEMLTFILDALHEDLNRIHKKPYIELKDSGGRPDAEVAAEAWQNYRKRNNSAIVDMFYGLLKSTVVCPECAKVSVTFDPYCMLQLPLPVKRERSIEVCVYWADSKRRPTLFKVTVSKSGSIGELCKALERLCHVPHRQLVVADVYNNKFHKIFVASDSVKDISDKDVICAYEVAPAADGLHNVPVYQRCGDGGIVGTPFFVCARRDSTTYPQLVALIDGAMARYTKQVSSADWWHGTTSTVNNGAAANSSSEDEAGADDPMDGGNDNQLPPAAFRLQLVNSSANTCISRLEARDPSRPLPLTAGAVVLVIWQAEAFAACVDTREADARHEHESLNAPLLKRPTIRLSDCIELFTTTEKLGANDAWYCPDCKRHQEATKKFDLWSLPDVLIIHLKRFSYTRIFRDKIDALVEFPTRGLDLRHHLLDTNQAGSTYDLIGVSNHYGGMGGGHYVAYCKNRIDNGWYYFDDSSVTEASEKGVCTKAAYVLVYMRREPLNAVSRVAAPSTAISNGRPDADDDGVFDESDSAGDMDSS